MISSQVSEKQELTPRESIDESRFEAGFCEFHGWFTAGIKSTDGTGAVGLLDVRDVWLKPKSKNCSAKA